MFLSLERPRLVFSWCHENTLWYLSGFLIEENILFLLSSNNGLTELGIYLSKYTLASALIPPCFPSLHYTPGVPALTDLPGPVETAAVQRQARSSG